MTSLSVPRTSGQKRGQSPISDKAMRQVGNSGGRFLEPHGPHVGTMAAMRTDSERWRHSRADAGSDCGWVDKVEWSGSVPQVAPAPVTTWTEVGYSYDPAGRRIEKKYDGTTVV